MGSFNDSELLEVAQDSLKLSTLHTKRFLKAMKQTKHRLNQPHVQPPELYNGASSSSSSSSSNSIGIHRIIRPISPALSVRSVDRNHYNINGNNVDQLSQQQIPATQSPSISSKYAYDRHYLQSHRSRQQHLRSASTHNLMAKMPKAKSQRFSHTKHKKRSQTETDLQLSSSNGHLPD